MPKTSRWELDPSHSIIEVAVKHMMFTTVRGRFTGVTGTLEVDEDRPDRSRVDVEIDAATFDTGIEDRDKHLRSADFLNVEKHPTIRFVSKRVEGAHKNQGDRFKVVGDLTIRGKTREVTLDATYAGVGKDPWGNQRAGFVAQTVIDRRDWGLTWNQALETGGILVGNELRIEINAQAVRKTEAREAAA